MTEAGKERTFKGIGVSGDTAIGPLHILREATGHWRSFTTAENETRILGTAIAAARDDIEALMASQDKLTAEILEFQLALLDDDDILVPVHRSIAGSMPADKAWAWVLDAEIGEYRKSGSEVLCARAADLSDLKARVLAAIRGDGPGYAPVPKNAIIVATELTPSQFINLNWNLIAGAAVLGGSPTSHVAILARARGLNLVVGLAAQLDDFAEGAPAILDGSAGTLTVEPGNASLAAAKTQIVAAKQDEAAVAGLLRHPARTALGELIKILVNIDEPGMLNTLSPDICDGVGLTRTEFLFKDGHRPGEDEQLAFYTRLIEWARGRAVTIRTLDAGGDKPIPSVTIDGESNSFLGVRGLRLSLAKPEIFRIQLRALARAAALGLVKVMFPMVTVPWEFEAARDMMLAEVADLQRAGIRCAVPPMGIMVEVPAAALTARAFPVDFYSIGSNDLIQYATASARDNAAVALLADPLNPAVVELIQRTVEAASAAGREVSLCGDMASSPAHIGPLIKCGLRILSCAPAQVGPVKLAVSRYGDRAHG
jgi:phosphotransferase system enzyme I (PtsI)